MNDPKRGDLLHVNSSAGCSSVFSDIADLRWKFVFDASNGTPVLFLGGLQPWYDNVNNVIYVFAGVLTSRGLGWVYTEWLERRL